MVVDDEFEAEDLLDGAIDAEESGEPGEALRSLDAAFALDPDLVEAWTRRAAILLWLELPDAALAAADAALERDPDDEWARVCRGAALTWLERAEDAVPEYERAIELAPDYAAAWSALGSAFDKLGRSDEAIAAAARATELDPDDPDFWVNGAPGFGRSIDTPRLRRRTSARSRSIRMMITRAATSSTRCLRWTGRATRWRCWNRRGPTSRNSPSPRPQEPRPVRARPRRRSARRGGGCDPARPRRRLRMVLSRTRVSVPRP